MNNLDLLEALQEASDTDIQRSETLKKTSQSRNKRITVALVASAAVLALILLAVPALNRQDVTPSEALGGTTEIEMNISDSEETERHPGRILSSSITEEDSLHFFLAPDNCPDFSVCGSIPLSCLEVTEGRERKFLYLLNALENGSVRYQLLRDQMEEFLWNHRQLLKTIRPSYTLAVRVYETSPVEGRELWIFPSMYYGGINGIFWARIDLYAGTCSISSDIVEPEEESWIRKMDMLGELTSETDPACLVLDGKQLLVLIGQKAYMLKDDPNVPTAAEIDLSDIDPGEIIPHGVVWELSMKTVRKYDVVRLTEEQKARYARVLYSFDTDPYLDHTDTSAMSREELDRYIAERSARQENAVRAGSILSSNARRFSNEEQKEYWREEYGGCYIMGDKLTVLIPEHVPGAEEWVRSVIPPYLSDTIVCRPVAHSYKELYEFMLSDAIPTLLNAGVNIYEYSVMESVNSIVVGVDSGSLIDACELALKEGWEGKVMIFESGPS